VEGLAVLGPVALVDVAGLDHVAGPLEDLLDPVADQRQLRPGADPVGQVDELLGLLELRA
jgi:hypothetical protein